MYKDVNKGIKIRKEAPYVRSSCRNLFACVRRHRRGGPARFELEFRRVEQHGCREKIMIDDSHPIP